MYCGAARQSFRFASTDRSIIVPAFGPAAAVPTAAITVNTTAHRLTIPVYLVRATIGLMPVEWIGTELFDRVLASARQSPRRRMNFNFHASLEDNPHRFLNVLLQGTYIRPHRHLDPPKPESFLALEGRIAVLLFDDEGKVIERRTLGASGLWGVDVPPGVWHTVACLTPHAVCYEVKPGPYSPLNDKDFAPWSPSEGDPAAQPYLAALLDGLG